MDPNDEQAKEAARKRARAEVAKRTQRLVEDKLESGARDRVDSRLQWVCPVCGEASAQYEKCRLCGTAPTGAEPSASDGGRVR